MAFQDLSQERRRRLTHRTVPLVAAALVVMLLVAIVNESCGGGDQEDTARRFVSAWERSDWEAMHRELTPGSQDRYPPAALERAYEAAAATATATAIEAGEPDADGDSASLEVTIVTRVFGRLRGELRLPIRDSRVDWKPELAFPGLEEGELLTRRSSPPRRAAILARDGTKIATGPGAKRTVVLPSASGIVGEVGPAPTPADREV